MFNWEPSELARGTYAGADFNGFGSFWSSVKGAVAKVVPSKTIVGKLLSGDVAGATQGAVKEVSKIANPPKATPAKLTTAANAGTGFFSGPNGPLLMAAGALGVAWFVIRKRR